MKDRYAIALFSMPVFNALLRKENYKEALFAAVFAFWFESIRNEKIESLVIPSLE